MKSNKPNPTSNPPDPTFITGPLHPTGSKRPLYPTSSKRPLHPTGSKRPTGFTYQPTTRRRTEPVDTATKPTHSINSTKKDESSNVPLIVGLSVAGVVLCVVFVAVVFFCYMKRYNGGSIVLVKSR